MTVVLPHPLAGRTRIEVRPIQLICLQTSISSSIDIGELLSNHLDSLCCTDHCGLDLTELGRLRVDLDIGFRCVVVVGTHGTYEGFTHQMKSFLGISVQTKKKSRLAISSTSALPKGASWSSWDLQNLSKVKPPNSCCMTGKKSSSAVTLTVWISPSSISVCF